MESEIHMVQALEDVKKAGCNALVVYLGNFGPEISETLLAKHFDGPKMFVAAAEERGDNLIQGRGDAYCGMLNASYNLKLRNVKVYIPEYPVGTAEECADMIHEFAPIAKAIIGLHSLKIISFGPRPLNFLACNAPIQQLYNLGVEIEENSELDLFEAFNKHADDERISEIVKEMEEERQRLIHEAQKNKENDIEDRDSFCGKKVIRSGSGEVYFTNVTLKDKEEKLQNVYKSHDFMQVQYDFVNKSDIEEAVFSVRIYKDDNTHCYGTTSDIAVSYTHLTLPTKRIV
mgnify:CR=1 FL=1